MAAAVTGICLGKVAGGANSDNRYSGSYTFNVTVNKEATNWGPRKVLVESDATNMTPNFGVPEIWDTLNIGADVDADIYCLNKSATWQEQDEDGGQLWDVTCDFGPLSAAGMVTDDLNENPTLRLARWRPDWETYTEVFNQEAESHPDTMPASQRAITNSAGTAFPRPHTIERQRRVWVFNIAVGSPSAVDAFFDDYGGRVNKTIWTNPGGVHLGLPDVPVRAALMRSIRAGDKIEEQGFSFYPVELTIAIKGTDEWVDDWTFRFLDWGTTENVDIGGGDFEWKEGRDGDGIPNAEPFNLNGAGARTNPDDIPNIFYYPLDTMASPNYMGFKTAEFNNIPFPT